MFPSHALLLALVALCPGAARAQSKPPTIPAASICQDIAQLVSLPAGKNLQRATPPSTNLGGKLSYTDLDVDRDGKSDVVARSCSIPGHAASYCVLEVQATSGLSYSLQENNLFVVRKSGVVYAISSEIGPKRQAGHGKVLLLSRNGPQSVCTGF